MSEIKPLAGLERRSLKDVILLSTPYSAYIFPTNLCNFECNYCGHALGLERMKQECDFIHQNMPFDIYTTAIDQLTEFDDKLKVISLTGHGEPLVNKDLPKIISYAKQKFVTNRIETISNAALLTHKLSDDLVDSGLDCIRISLQGLSTEKYIDVCNRNVNFEKLVDEIAYLYNHRKQCEVYVKIMNVALKMEKKSFIRFLILYLTECLLNNADLYILVLK